MLCQAQVTRTSSEDAPVADDVGLAVVELLGAVLDQVFDCHEPFEGNA